MPTIAVLPGDGIGPEVTRAAVRVLHVVRPDVECVETPVGGAALLVVFDEDAVVAAAEAEGLLGAVGAGGTEAAWVALMAPGSGDAPPLNCRVPERSASVASVASSAPGAAAD